MQLGALAFYLDDARDIAESLESSLSDWNHDQPFGMTVTYVEEVTAARQAAAAAQARESEHLGSWRQLVARLEPMRDALLERLRDELGERFHVPTPMRVP